MKLQRFAVENCFSELKWIKNEDLRDKAVEVWKKAADRGKWETLDDVPFTLLIENSGLLTDHTKRIATLAKSVMGAREEDLNEDYA